MASRFELLNNLHRAMMPLAHWYDIIDSHVILELQNKVTQSTAQQILPYKMGSHAQTSNTV